MKYGFLFLSAALLLGGCVSTGTYDKKVAELAACQTGGLAFEEKTKKELDDSFVAKQKLETDLHGVKSDYEACQKVAEDARKYADQLKQRETDLRGRLQKELTDKDVEISSLRGKLSVSVLDQILFKSGRADILPAGEAILEKVARVLAATDDMIRVEGHTDNVPISGKLREKYFSNWELSAARAASVVRYFQLGENKIDPLRLEAAGYAEYRPVAPNDDDANRRRNRRVEIILTAVKPTAEVELTVPAADSTGR